MELHLTHSPTPPQYGESKAEFKVICGLVDSNRSSGMAVEAVVGCTGGRFAKLAIRLANMKRNNAGSLPLTLQIRAKTRTPQLLHQCSPKKPSDSAVLQVL